MASRLGLLGLFVSRLPTWTSIRSAESNSAQKQRKDRDADEGWVCFFRIALHLKHFWQINTGSFVSVNVDTLANSKEPSLLLEWLCKALQFKSFLELMPRAKTSKASCWRLCAGRQRRHTLACHRAGASGEIIQYDEVLSLQLSSLTRTNSQSYPSSVLLIFCAIWAIGSHPRVNRIHASSGRSIVVSQGASSMQKWSNCKWLWSEECCLC